MDNEKETEFVVPDMVIKLLESPPLRKEIQRLRKKYSDLAELFDRMLEDGVEDE